MESGVRPEGAAVDTALDAWRRKAADLLLIAAAVVHLPVLILLLLGYGAPMGWWLRDMTTPIYLVMVAVALFRTVSYRTRLSVFFVALYVGAAIMTLVNPLGPYSEVGLVAVPILVLVLLGNRPAAVAIGASATIFLSATFLRARPSVIHLLGIDPSYVYVAAKQITALATWLVALMVLLNRFVRFLLSSLAAQYRANAALEMEVVERTAAQRKAELEMRERQRLEREIAAIGDRERRRLGQELHDGVCQQVTAALLRCQALERRMERGGTVSGTDFAPLSSLLADTIDDAHNVARGLCPLEPEPEALAPALRALTRRTQELATVRCECMTAGDVRVADPEVAQHLYRIAQEALSNAVRHAKASNIRVGFRGTDGEFILQVEDDGVGLPAASPEGGMGLRTMMYRAQILGGEISVTPAPGSGTRVTCRVPRSHREPGATGDPGGRRCLPAA
jgi:signal transduction histidine kinase